MGRTPKPWFYRQTGWWMAWLNGKKTKLAKGRGNKKAAQDRLMELLLEASRNPQPDTAGQTVASVIETYLQFARNWLGDETLSVRRVYLQSFAEDLGWRSIAEAKPYQMEAWLHAHPEWRSDWTKSSALRHVHVAFNWAARSGIIGANPFRGVTHRAGKPRREVTPQEFLSILRATRNGFRKTKPTPSGRFREILVFLWYTGCRPSEAAKLQWANVDFDNSLITLSEHKTSRTQRSPRPRIIPLHPLVVRLLRSIQKRNEGEVVFLTHRHTPWTRNSLAQRLRRARRKAGVPEDAKLYGVRHAFGTRGVLNGCDLKTLAELMGHTTTRMTEHYVHLAGQHEHLASAMRRVNGRRQDG